MSKRRQNGFVPSWAVVGLFALALSACDPMGQTTIGPDYYPGITLSYFNSTVSVSSDSVASGGSVVVTVDLRDTNYNPFISTLPAVVFQASGGTSTGTFSSVTNNLDGSYSATFTGVTIGTATTIEAVVDGNVLSGAPSVTVSGTLTVTSAGDGNEIISPNTTQAVNYDATQSFTVTANANYSLSLTVGGTCAAGSWSGSTYATGAITGNCTVTFSATSLAGASLTADSINTGSILAYVFKEGSGTTLYDISPAANNGTTNATWAFDSGEGKEIQTFNVPSEASQAISVTPNSAQWTALPQFSAYFRVNIYNVIPSDYEHFFEFGASLAPDYLFFRPSQNSFTPSFFNCCGNYSEVASPDSTPSFYGSWHDFTVTYDNTSGASNLYIDGTLNASGSLLPGMLAGSIGGFNIFDGDSTNFQVSASVVRFWNRVITSAEVSELHSNPMTGVTTP